MCDAKPVVELACHEVRPAVPLSGLALQDVFFLQLILVGCDHNIFLLRASIFLLKYHRQPPKLRCLEQSGRFGYNTTRAHGAGGVRSASLAPGAFRHAVAAVSRTVGPG